MTLKTDHSACVNRVILDPMQGRAQVLVPGELEFRNLAQRKQTGIPIDPATWQQLVDYTTKLNIPLDG